MIISFWIKIIILRESDFSPQESYKINLFPIKCVSFVIPFVISSAADDFDMFDAVIQAQHEQYNKGKTEGQTVGMNEN